MRPLLVFDHEQQKLLGKPIYLQTEGALQPVDSSIYPFILDNGQKLTYGQLIAFSGDFYGSRRSICLAQDIWQMTTRFREGFDTINSVWAAKEIPKLLEIFAGELRTIGKAIQSGHDASPLYADVDANDELLSATAQRPPHVRTYHALLHQNLDHFGDDAELCYLIGHKLAQEVAFNGQLDKGYMLNAWADHYLIDLFSAGHLRTPRRAMHVAGRPYEDLCAKVMFDEENAIGLRCSNEYNKDYVVYGDTRFFDAVDDANRDYATRAVQLSADEVYSAWLAGSNDQQFKARQGALAYRPRPFAEEKQSLRALFKMKPGDKKHSVLVREPITSRAWNDSLWSAKEPAFGDVAFQLATTHQAWFRYPISFAGHSEIGITGEKPKDKFDDTYANQAINKIRGMNGGHAISAAANADDDDLS